MFSTLMSEDIPVFQSLLAIYTVSVITLQLYYFNSNIITQFDHWPYLPGTNTNWHFLDVLGNTKDIFLGSDLQAQFISLSTSRISSKKFKCFKKSSFVNFEHIQKYGMWGADEWVSWRLVVTRIFKNIHSSFSRNSTSRN